MSFYWRILLRFLFISWAGYLALLLAVGAAGCLAGPGEQALPPASTTGEAKAAGTVTPETMPGIAPGTAWAQYGLAGKLILIEYQPKGNRLIELNLASGEIKTLFKAPENSWLSEAQVFPGGGQILLSYAPPPPGNATQDGYSDLYLLSYDGSGELQPLTIRTDLQESFFFSAWAPDGKTIYTTHLYRIDPDSAVPAYQNVVETLTLDGQSRKIIDDALWPAVSPDGARLSYLYADPVTFSNDLYLANADGSGQTPVLPPGVSPPVDAHLFTIDGTQLIFSMVNSQPAPASSWLEQIFGVEVASAHSVPSDWYRLPVGGGTPQRLTNLDDMNLNGDLSPDGSRLAFIGASGLYIMNIDGSNLIRLSKEGMIGTVDWIP